MLINVIVAFDKFDADLAIKVRNGEVMFDKLHTKIHLTVTEPARDDTDPIVSNVHLLFISKNFERIVDFAITDVHE